MASNTLSILFIFTIYFSILFTSSEASCIQKNTRREAHRDIYLCTNQYFEPGKKVADPENCECYYDCNYRQQPCYTCCPHGQVFNPKLNECVLREAYRCKNEPPKYQCEGIGLFRHKDHCRKYWDCRVDKKHLPDLPVEEACPEDHHWDDQAKVCRKDSEVSRSVCSNDTQ